MVMKSEVVQSEVSKGTENLIGIVSVSCAGTFRVIDVLNHDTVNECYLEDCQEYLEGDFNEEPGIYLIEFRIEGSRDYWGEYDAWSVIDNILRYKNVIDNKISRIENKTYLPNMQNILYDNENHGEEYPKFLIACTYDGGVVLLDILNEDVANTKIIEEVVGYSETYYMEDAFNEKHHMKTGLYTANIFMGDMEYIFDDTIKINATDIKEVPLVLEDDPSFVSKTFTKKEYELQEFADYVERLRMQEEEQSEEINLQKDRDMKEGLK